MNIDLVKKKLKEIKKKMDVASLMAEGEEGDEALDAKGFKGKSEAEDESYEEPASAEADMAEDLAEGEGDEEEEKMPAKPKKKGVMLAILASAAKPKMSAPSKPAPKAMPKGKKRG